MVIQLSRGRLAVVTGGSNGIGRALAEALTTRGLRVVSLDRETRAESGDQVHEVSVDVRDGAAMSAAARRIGDEFGAVDLLCCNAGVGLPRIPLWQVDAADADRVWRVNVSGMLNSVRAFVPSMVQQGSGHVLTTCSYLGLSIKPGGGNGVYAASKHAVAALSESLANEFAALGIDIGVTCLCPGPVSTKLLEDAHAPARPSIRASWPDRVDIGLSELSPASVAETALDAVERGAHYAVTGRDAAEFVIGRLNAQATDVARFWDTAAPRGPYFNL